MIGRESEGRIPPGGGKPKGGRNPHKKLARPFGQTSAPFDSRKGRYFPVHDPRQIAAFFVVEELADSLKCYDLGKSGKTANRSVTYVKKPYMLQQTPFDSQTDENGVSYAYVTIGNRTASAAGEDDEDQYITPSYLQGDNGGGEYILAAKDVKGRWTDLNTCGRVWAVLVPEA